MLNIPRLAAVRDALAHPPTGVYFDMNRVIYETEWGTAACIKGFAIILFGDSDLGLTNEECDNLFYPDIPNYRDVTAAQAIATLETGEVKWII